MEVNLIYFYEKVLFIFKRKNMKKLLKLMTRLLKLMTNLFI
jgi:hypothetical protein